ncbi:ABC transporter permease [Latilactobacillus graminis]|uniref:Putative hemin transport system permease protein HrtB n=2 Tax=Latilactobacillus graminis TaxID=60519 RepID=A0AA89I223_9LACO|nr:FtsX-like permease family protein [Latilactobacillus graminis]KRM22389.1 permease family protein [Latilactobacillus graminis DSM 20719]QFP79437.1 FtsX-like permease family protein [Latilactobacillus graminis]
MYLALKEIKHAKLRYSLIIFTIFLIAYLIYFLTGLAYGLANNNRSAIDQWHAKEVIISQYANKNLAASELAVAQLPPVSGDQKDTAQLGQMMGVVSGTGLSKQNTSIFGIAFDTFLKPELQTGRYPQKANEVVVDDGLQGVKLKQQIKLNGHQQQYTIVGITNNHRYNTQPVTYLRLTDFSQLRYGTPQVTRISAFVLKGKAHVKATNQLTKLTISQMINKIPGYGPQVKTFALMISALLVIVAFIVGIFMYIITIEKTAIYGVMRAQGISGMQLVISLMWQSIFLGVIGIGLGLLGNVLTTIGLPAAVPYTNNPELISLFSGVLLIMTVVGALFSIWRILKIDPLDAIGGA